MIIPNIKYIGYKDTIQCSMSACLSMMLTYYNFNPSPTEIADLFGTTFMSKEFRNWQIQSINTDKSDNSIMVSCACYTIESNFNNIEMDVIDTKVKKIPLSYLKRKIPVILTGQFPMLGSKIANSILVKGYVDNYLIVNDPKGNTYTGYKDRFGENMLYHIDDIEKWISKSNETQLLRANIKK